MSSPLRTGMYTKQNRDDRFPVVDDAVNINAIEQYLGDYALNMMVAPETRQHVGRVAVVGSGPAGLSCAYFLAARGFQVTIFEARTEPGGMLRYSIPLYRLPVQILNSFISKLEDMGVTIKCNHGVNNLDDLNRDFRAIFVATGAGISKKLNIPGVDHKGIYYGLEFLQKIRTGLIQSVPPSAVVIGGGDVAMDAAQTARRLGARQVTVLALEAENCLPAHRHNIDSTLRQGIELNCCWGVESFSRDGANDKIIVNAAHCLAVFDDKGAFAPRYDHSLVRNFSADTVILAVGQERDLSLIPARLIGADGKILEIPATQQTLSPLISAGGDVVDGPASVAQAIAGAKRAAKAIELSLSGLTIVRQEEEKFEIISDLPAPDRIKRARRHERLLAEQTESFSEMYKGFGLVETLTEVERCITCGAKSIAAHPDDCMTCFECELNCPTEAIFVHPFKEILPRAFKPVDEDVRTTAEEVDQLQAIDNIAKKMGVDNVPSA